VKGCLATLLALIVVLQAALAGPDPGPMPGAMPAPGASQTFLFASPNKRDALTDEEANVRLTSFEELNATAVADRAACAITHSVQIAESLGIYDKSSENSFILEGNLQRKESEYLAALLGLYSRQEFILLFLSEAGGPDRLWLIKTPQPLDAVIATLRKLRLVPVTVRTEQAQTEIWYVDVGEQRAGDLKIFTSNVNGQASLTAGVAEMLGNQSRAAAVKIWRQQISALERQSRLHLSSRLSSRQWRQATTTHTCSTDLSIP
jgi:hypothetical protein